MFKENAVPSPYFSWSVPCRMRLLGFFLATGILFCSSALSLRAQGREFGFRAGVLGGQSYNEEGLQEEGIATLYAGLYVGRPLGSTFFTSFITGLDYMKTGYSIDDQNFRKLFYAGIPLALRIHFGPWHLQGGVSANIKLYERWVDQGLDMLHEDNRSSPFDLPILLGAGVRITDVVLEARFYYGWMDVYEGNKNIYLQLGLAYSF